MLEDTQLINRNFKTIVFNFEQIFKSVSQNDLFLYSKSHFSFTEVEKISYFPLAYSVRLYLITSIQAIRTSGDYLEAR